MSQFVDSTRQNVTMDTWRGVNRLEIQSGARCGRCIIFLQIWFSPILVITTEYNIFGFVQCKYIWILLVTFRKNRRSFGMGLSTRASRLLHKCRENDTICVLNKQS